MTGGDENGAPRPRENPDLVGHGDAERTLRDALDGGRLAHAWLITGPRGVGKATLAYRFARYLLAHGGEGGGASDLFGDDTGGALHVAPDDPVFARIAAGSHGEVMTIERSRDPKTKKLRSAILVDDVRRLGRFFGLTASEGGWRIAIIDAADEMNRNAANALLKMLEEPPARAILLLVAHAPGRLPATIRSRCRRLALRPLDGSMVGEIVARHHPDLAAEDCQLIAGLADGSPGRALALAAEGGSELHRDLTGLLEPLPDLDMAAVHDLADRLATSDDAFRLFADLIESWLAGAIRDRALAGSGGEARRQNGGDDIEPWAEAWDRISLLVERTVAVNLDKRSVVVGIFSSLQGAARGAAAK